MKKNNLITINGNKVAFINKVVTDKLKTSINCILFKISVLKKHLEKPCFCSKIN